MAEEGREKAMKAVEAIFERYNLICISQSSPHYFDTHLMRTLKLVDASSTGTSTYELLISPEFGNVNGVMHGGAAAVIFDMTTTTALGPLAKKKFWDFLGGVTRTLNVSYLKAIPIGTTVRIHSEVQQIGRTMALMRGTMSSLDGKIIYCTCEHHKVSVPTPAHHLEFKVPWDDLWDNDGKAKL